MSAYHSLKNSGRDLKNTDENSITAQLVGFMTQSPRRKNLQICVHREHYLDTQDTYDGNADANESARIDLKYVVWNSNNEHEYYMEAKNVGQRNWNKPESDSIVDAGRLRRRYIDTGVTNFLSRRYPSGALVGYVLEGNCDDIVGQINELLSLDNRSKECLVKSKGYRCDSYYVSQHIGFDVDGLKHFFLNFAN